MMKKILGLALVSLCAIGASGFAMTLGEALALFQNDNIAVTYTDEGREQLLDVIATLRSALGVLNDRERRIFEARRLADDPVTLEQLSEEFSISRERVRQIEVRAFEKVQAAVRAGVARLETIAPAKPQIEGRPGA